ncbi:MAG: nucleotidyltransferase family protein [Thermoleophilia bacterium]
MPEPRVEAPGTSAPPVALTGPAEARLWGAVDRWIGPVVHEDDLAEHRLQLLAARALRQAGRPVPEGFIELESIATVVGITAPLVLERVRAAVDGPVVLFKGMEVAAHYPDPALRLFHDLDILVPDAPAAQRALIAAGFEEVGEPEVYEDIHHLRPLKLPSLPTIVEVHHAPKWPLYATPPPASELIARAVPGHTGVDGVLALDPASHALVLAAHSWSNVPLGCIRDLVDVQLVARRSTPAEVASLARRWGVAGMWGTTDAAARAVLAGGRPTLPMLTWAGGLRAPRGRTVLESHLERWFAGFWAVPARHAADECLRVARKELRPEGGEGWPAKLSRSAAAVRGAGRRKADHDAGLAEH